MHFQLNVPTLQSLSLVDSHLIKFELCPCVVCVHVLYFGCMPVPYDDTRRIGAKSVARRLAILSAVAFDVATLNIINGTKQSDESLIYKLSVLDKLQSSENTRKQRRLVMLEYVESRKKSLHLLCCIPAASTVPHSSCVSCPYLPQCLNFFLSLNSCIVFFP